MPNADPHYYQHAFIRLKPGTSFPAARAEMQALVDQFARQDPNNYPQNMCVKVVTINEEVLGHFAGAIVFCSAPSYSCWPSAALTFPSTAATLASGLALGLLLRLALNRLVYSSAGGNSRDPLTLLAATALLVFVAALACIVPAWRAASIDPMRALLVE